jgi:hypothetical protein
MELSSERRKLLYNTIRMRFIERAKAEKGNAKHWKTIKIENLNFNDYYHQALNSLEFRIDNDLSDVNDRETWMMWHGEPLSKDEMQRKREKEAVTQGEGTEYSLNPEVLKMWNRPSEEARERKIQRIAREFNENVEEDLKKKICPRCKSSVCHCQDY